MAASLQAILKKYDRRVASRQFGDLFFDLVNLARLAEIHPESALSGSVKIFESRFKKMEEMIAESKREFDEISPEEKKLLWQKVKNSVPS